MPNGMESGYGAPFVRIYYEDKELSAKITSFSYAYDEEDDDTCTIELETDRREDPDEKWYQEKTALKILWGYIEGIVSEVIKVYIQEVKWDFSDSNIKGTLTCTEKAVSMKFVDSQRVYKDASIVDVTKDIAQRHGLKAYVEVNDGDFKDEINLQPLPGESADKYLARRAYTVNRIYVAEHPREIDSINRERREVASKIIPLNGTGPVTKADVDKAMKFKLYPNIPQANKTDAQVLSELGRKEKKGPYFAETRGDTITLKRRNFNQAPYKSYTYGGTTGDLLGFIPESKNRGRKGSSVNKQYGGWNADEKTYYSGDANSTNSVQSPMLANLLEQLKLYKTFQKYPGGGQLRAGFTQEKNRHVFIGKNNITARADNTLTYKDQVLSSVVTVDDKVKALEKAVAGVNDIIKNYNNTLYNPAADNAEDAFHRASNDRESAELKKNPASAKLVGDPRLTVGKIITILGLSKKYSGNYYITKCNHKLDSGSGFYTELEMVRQGVNLKVNDDFEDTKSLGKSVNTQIGPSRGKEHVKVLTNKKNP